MNRRVIYYLFLNNFNFNSFSCTCLRKFFCCCNKEDNKKNNKKNIKNDDFKKKSNNDLNLDKNIPKNFKNNKERVYKMIKVFNKDFKKQDIDEILLLIYNLGKYEKGACCELLFNKLKVDKNEDVISIVHDKNEKNEDIIYIFYYKKDTLKQYLVFLIIQIF